MYDVPACASSQASRLSEIVSARGFCNPVSSRQGKLLRVEGKNDFLKGIETRTIIKVLAFLSLPEGRMGV